LLLYSYPDSYCGESKQVSNKYPQANYTPLRQQCQSQAFCHFAPLVSTKAKSCRLAFHRVANFSCWKNWEYVTKFRRDTVDPVSRRRGRVTSPTINEHILNGARPELTLSMNVLGCWEALAGADLQTLLKSFAFPQFYHGQSISELLNCVHQRHNSHKAGVCCHVTSSMFSLLLSALTWGSCAFGPSEEEEAHPKADSTWAASIRSTANVMSSFYNRNLSLILSQFICTMCWSRTISSCNSPNLHKPNSVDPPHTASLTVDTAF